VKKRELQRSMYELKGTSTAQRLAMAALVGIWVLAAWWMPAGGGLAMLGERFGWAWHEGDAARCICLAAGFSIYYLRILFAQFVFLKRGMSWNESLPIAVWLLFIVLLLGIAGGCSFWGRGSTRTQSMRGTGGRGGLRILGASTPEASFAIRGTRITWAICCCSRACA
jgi:hypothetical protein